MNEPSRELDADVLVVGAGPVGLALGLELGLRGRSVVIAEQQARAGAQPRAKTTNVRTMQHMRRWGLAEVLRDAAPLPRDYPTDVVFATSLFGRTLAVIENAFEGAKRRDDRFPEPAQWVPQYTVEAVLRERIAALPNVTLSFGVALEDATQDGSGVTATLRDAGAEGTRLLRTAFVVGADGARSRTRSAMGVKMEGDHAYAHNFNLILRIPDLERDPPARRAIMYWTVNPKSPGVWAPLDTDGRWSFGTVLPPGERDMPDAEIIARVHATIGRPLDVEILTRDVWAAHRLVANSYRAGRMFLAGDACHLHPPFGGYGMNLGIADAVDLGWKLSAVLEGWGGEDLLASYEAERRPVHLRTIEEAVANYGVLSQHLLKDSLDEETPEGEQARAEVGAAIMASKPREFHTLGVVLGSRYENSPVIVGDGSPPPAEHHTRYEPSARPGSLAPHAWLSDGASLYDRFGPGYTLLLLAPDAAAAAVEIETAANAAGVPMRVLDLAGEGLATLYRAPLALVRPDQHIAWRGERAHARALVDTIRGAASLEAENRAGKAA